MKNNINIPHELFRLKIKELAEEVRIKFAKKGLSDIFDILSETAFLIRKPLDIEGLSGFITYFENRFIVYLNTNFTLGHERYTAAHELYHIIYNEDILKREKVFLDKEKYKEEETKADVFAAEFLMPEDYVKEIFYKFINVDKEEVQPKHVVRMHNYFKVSYKAMLKRLIQLNLCSMAKYSELVEISSLENKDKLQSLTKEEGYNIDLIVPSKENYIPHEYIMYAKANYENGKICYDELKEALEFINPIGKLV
ncbi:ImmA/IrrE family metallo-endopeptidase [Schnuerera ultunensis]|uniref:ImmA/IrrE family metallo-endopeptidase n=1 Tax=Schnuerera ultunensis TaxID=45497 RepID=UPI000425328D|nr:ImmA/IrrE family metallo-endopeptidase [Schnuerera ultunensis]